MTRFFGHSAAVDPPGGAGPARSRAAFSLVELMVVMSIMVLLLGLVSAAVSGARGSSKKQATRLLISKLDTIMQQQFASYASRTGLPAGSSPPAGWTNASYRSWHIRRNLITGDLPDRWSDVAVLANGTLPLAASGTNTLPCTAPQRTYAAIWNGLSDSAKATVGEKFAGAECLFMIVMQGGVANCLDCGELRTAERGDKDGDGMHEFWDAWGNPIGFILWPAGLELPVGKPFFLGSRALEPFPAARGAVPSPSLGMRPLIYSAGPDGEDGFDRGNDIAQLTLGGDPITGSDCGNGDMNKPTAAFAGQKLVEGIDYRADNLTNFDDEAAK